MIYNRKTEYLHSNESAYVSKAVKELRVVHKKHIHIISYGMFHTQVLRKKDCCFGLLNVVER